MLVSAAAALLLILPPTAVRAEISLDRAAALSESAARSATDADAREAALAAMDASPAAPVVDASGSAARRGAPLLQGAGFPGLTASAPPPSEPTIAELRLRRGRPRAEKETGKALAQGIAGFAVGAALGSVAGAAVAGYGVVTAPNPGLKYWKWLLVLPAMAIGAVVGQLAMPFVAAWAMYKSEAYD